MEQIISIAFTLITSTTVALIWSNLLTNKDESDTGVQP